MNPLDILMTALRSLASNKLRAALTLLGIVIGVTAVIVLISLGQGVQQSITSEFESLGTNLITVTPGSSDGDGFGAFFGAGGDTDTLTLNDAYALLDPVSAPSVVAVAPEINTWAHVEFGRSSDDTTILGVTADYDEVRLYEVEHGEFIAPVHVRDAASVAVIGAGVSESLFGLRNPVGQSLKLNDKPFTIIGVLESKEGGFFGFLDRNIMIPITTAHYRLYFHPNSKGEIQVGSISVQAASSDATKSAEREITEILRLRHRIVEKDDFTITTQEQALEAIASAVGVFTVFLGSIAAISLLVGGIGIMNIMFVTVTERTREIGIRKAMGAKRRDILLQFVTEAAVLSFGGGLIGLALGGLITLALNGQTIFGGDSPPLETSVDAQITLLALGVSIGIGLFFGIYPALRAARLHPIDALRYE